MTIPNFRIPVDQNYVLAIGRAVYNFAYMESGIVWTLHRLNGADKASIRYHEGGETIEQAFRRAIRTTKLPISAELKRELMAMAREFSDAADDRNNLLHATPFTAKGGAQRLSGKAHRHWMTADVYAAAKRFEDLSLRYDPVRNQLVALLEARKKP